MTSVPETTLDDVRIDLNLNNPNNTQTVRYINPSSQSRPQNGNGHQASKSSGVRCSKPCLIGLGIGLAIGVLLVIVIAVPVGLTRSSSSDSSNTVTTNQVNSGTTSQVTTTTVNATNLQLVQNCIGQDISRQPVIIDTDVDIDDLWAILYLINVPTVDVVAITTVGDGFSAPLYSTSNVLSLLGLVGCTDGIPVASGFSVSSLSTGWTVANSILTGIDDYLTSSSCLNQSTDIFLQPSPFDAVELIIYTLKYSQRPVDILVLGPFTNIAAAITRDRSIVSKIGTLYVSGGQFKSISDYPTLIPNPSLGTYPYLVKPSGTSSNVFLDLLAVQRVDDSLIKNYVAMPSSIQHQLPANLSQVDMKLKALNITLSPFIYKLITSLANCTNQAESAIYWWDNSAAQLMVQMQNNNTNGFCTTFQNVQSLYILSADSDQLFGQGLIDFQNTLPNTEGLSNYTICTQANEDTFLTEFLTKISSNNLYSCEATYKNRFDIKLQLCLATYGYN
ncbi:unnamed protein product [Adineta steineri]|uniref:Inosine/uridine-preferring nucleoside hydrolase domain-containing protein n=1 Tax=Adineta steineri TaxID=433720 RepID=A0A815GB95_9BILA|nr:unnamed protein product [Adineta steineri]CAF4149621.1 unnamed protein product [Adineta steineri]